MSTYPLKESSHIFLEVAKKFDNLPISGPANVAAFFAEMESQLGGWVILDFLDMANWDRIEKYSIDPESGILTLTWHDYREKLENEDEKESRQMFFPASLYGCALHINSIVPIIGKSTAVFLINGYAKTEKEIRKLYSPNADDFKLLDNSFFEKRVVRRVDGHFEVIDFHCTPIFSLAIVPKQSGLGSHHSKKILYAHNFRIAIERLNAVVKTLDAMSNPSSDDIAEKVNTVRRIMEFVLKVECCSRELKVNKNYSMALLGDLISALKPTKEDHIQTLLARFVEYANEFSHDSGKPIEISKAKLVVALALAYASLIEIEHK
jgi:hypothetical protein